MTSESDDASGTAAGQPAALLDTVFASHRATAVAVARRILGDAHLAEDAVQLAYLQLLGRVRRGDTALLRDNPRGVILRGTRWAALKLVERDRDRHAAAALDETLCAGSEPWERVEARMVSQDIVAALPPHYRDAVVLRYFEDQPDDRAAARLALTVKAYRRRLDRAMAMARSQAGRGLAGGVAALPGTLRRGGARLRAAFLRLDARGRQARARIGEAAGGPGISHWAVVVTIAGVSAGVLWPTVAPRGRGAAQAAVATASHDPAGSFPAGPGVPGGGGPRGAADGAAVSGAGVSAASPRPVATTSTGLPLLSSSPPPPESATITQVVPAPGYDSNHVVVMRGGSATCNCGPLYRSMDGGATWDISDLGLQAGVIALPPAYPEDPAIVVDERNGPDSPDCVLPDFHATGCSPIPLFGAAFFDSQYDSGTPVLYGFGPDQATLLAYNTATHVLRPVVLPPRTTVTALLTPPATSAVHVYVAATVADATAAPWDRGGRAELFGCDGSQSCTPVSLDGFGIEVGTTEIDREDATGTSIAGRIGDDASARTWQYALSTDGGRSFALQIDVDSWTESTVLHPIGPAGRQRLYQELYRGAATPFERLYRWDVDGARTEITLPFATTSDATVHLVPITSTRVIAYSLASSQPGIWCSVDSGMSWQHGCPPA